MVVVGGSATILGKAAVVHTGDSVTLEGEGATVCGSVEKDLDSKYWSEESTAYLYTRTRH